MIITDLGNSIDISMRSNGKKLGGGTGQLKLRYVYDKAIQRFPWLSIVPFETFKGWVDSALDEMKKQLGENAQVKAYIEGE